ncbi:hypothetical protein PPTG_20905 [Phytophthora nicotianae INRA-310]|uniref:Uncharacterized protein n=4 Tax=Phytophthora nicotianae TaxID=4792 RepID=W2RAD2_PHYN3|nr:hypothetical protein PPTG_20905 [Phytophthora nicotianae INRA-310]ETI50287.1 hypothetical protein F443_06140 [Phytophthora nicotianae P1569]ETM49895.1 hypothetical protein L914_05964 [Phytophthora nicotianae]ETN22307.1 hypothetical protein PPTG_20905 [Phytophthora nicotianae INRA-310]
MGFSRELADEALLKNKAGVLEALALRHNIARSALRKNYHLSFGDMARKRKRTAATTIPYAYQCVSRKLNQVCGLEFLRKELQ